MIKVGFSTTNAPVSWLIKKSTNAKVSHSFIIFPWLGQDWVLESGFFGVVIIPLKEFKRSNIVVETIPLPGVNILDLKPALSQLGKRYDFGGLFGNVWVQLGRFFKLKWHNPWQNSKALFCSEFIVENLLQPLEWPGADELIASETNPEDLRQYLSK